MDTISTIDSCFARRNIQTQQQGGLSTSRTRAERERRMSGRYAARRVFGLHSRRKATIAPPPVAGATAAAAAPKAATVGAAAVRPAELSAVHRASAWAQRNPRTSAGMVAAAMGWCGDLAAQKIEMRAEARDAAAAAKGGGIAASGATTASGAVVTSAGTSSSVSEHAQTPPTKALNYMRAFAMASFCTFMGAVIYVPFYFALDKYIGSGTTIKIVIQKIAVNQLALSPFVDLPIYFSWTGFLDGLSPSDSWKRFTTQYWDTLYGTWAIWTPVGIVNFMFVPLHLRVPVAYVGEFFWSISTSYLSHRPIEDNEEYQAAREKTI